MRWLYAVAWFTLAIVSFAAAFVGMAEIAWSLPGPWSLLVLGFAAPVSAAAGTATAWGMEHLDPWGRTFE